MKTLTFIMLMIICALGCVNSNSEKEKIRKVLGMKVSLESFDTIISPSNNLSYDEFIAMYDHFSIVYLQEGCPPCYESFINWEKKMRTVGEDSSYTVLFIIRGESFSSFLEKVYELEVIDRKYHVIMDTDSKFLLTNTIPVWALNRTILVDQDHKIRMIGAPFASDNMTKLFYKILQERM